MECHQQILANYSTLTEKLWNYCDYFSRLLEFPDLSGKVFLITYKFF